MGEHTRSGSSVTVMVHPETITALGTVLRDLSEWIALRASLSGNGQLQLQDAPGTQAYHRLLGDWERARTDLCAALDGLATAATTAGAAYLTVESQTAAGFTAGGGAR